MAKTVQIKLGDYRWVYLKVPATIECRCGDMVILEFERGLEHGEIIAEHDEELAPSSEEGVGKLMRLMTDDDLKKIEENKVKAKEAMDCCLKKIAERKLDMQLFKAEYSFDGSKVIFYFTSEGRVDFRALVKDLAKILRVRIELKQVGVRDKARIVGSFSICGRELCCSSYMKGFHPLSIKMPKEQNLPLNPARISGLCGRIKCCMAYEYLVYKEFAKDLPRLGEKVTTPQGKGKVIDINILKRNVTVDFGEGKIAKVVYPKENEN